MSEKEWHPRGLLGVRVWVLLYNHKHGTDVGLYSTEGAAYHAAGVIIEQYLEDLDDERQVEIANLLSAGRIADAMVAYEEATGSRESFELVERRIES